MQCIGVTKEITIDCYNGKIKPGMEFLLCTDGFYGMLREEEIYEVEASKDEMKRWVRECFDKVKERGELDNLSMHCRKSFLTWTEIVQETVYF